MSMLSILVPAYNEEGNVRECHARFHTFFQIDVIVKVFCGPEIHQPDGLISAANAVNAPEPLQNPHRIPVNVIIDKKIAVLQILSLADAVCGNQNVNFLCHRSGIEHCPVFGNR